MIKGEVFEKEHMGYMYSYTLWMNLHLKKGDKTRNLTEK